jgi:hypothetical protein
MPDIGNQSELEALQTLLNRGVITQEQFDQLSAEVTTNHAIAFPPLPPPVQSRSWTKKKITAVSMFLLVVVAVGIGLAIKQQQDSQRREAQKNAQEALANKACSNRNSLATAWDKYIGVLNKNTDYSRATSLMQARAWSLDRNDATSDFRQALKRVDHPAVISSRDALLRQVNLLEDTLTLMGGADTWSEFNSLITTANLLGNDLNEFKEDVFDALIKACNKTSK